MSAEVSVKQKQLEQQQINNLKINLKNRISEVIRNKNFEFTVANKTNLIKLYLSSFLIGEKNFHEYMILKFTPDERKIILESILTGDLNIDVNSQTVSVAELILNDFQIVQDSLKIWYNGIIPDLSTKKKKVNKS